MPELVYKHDSHEYLLGGLKLLSNTDVLKAAGLVDYSKVNEKHLQQLAEIGTAVHEATALLDKGLPWKRKFDCFSGYIDAWKALKKEFKFKPIVIEEPMAHPTYYYGTTPDRYGMSKFGPTVFQVKTGPVGDWVGVQLAAEEQALKASGHPVDTDGIGSSRNRWAASLHWDGSYRVRRFEEADDFRVFLACLRVATWRRDHKIPCISL